MYFERRNARIALATSCAIAMSLSASMSQAGELHEAVRDKDVSAFETALADDANIDETDFILGTPLHVAVSQGDLEFVSRIVQSGADIEAPSELASMRALHLAVDYGDAALVELLIALGADVDAQTPLGETPLIVSARRGGDAITKLLLRHTSELETREQTKGLSALGVAALHGNFEVARTIVEAGADVEATNSSGRSVFFIASSYQSYKRVGSGDLIRYLANNGADIDRKDAAGFTPLSYAVTRIDSGYHEVAEILRDLGATE